MVWQMWRRQQLFASGVVEPQFPQCRAANGSCLSAPLSPAVPWVLLRQSRAWFTASQLHSAVIGTEHTFPTVKMPLCGPFPLSLIFLIAILCWSQGPRGFSLLEEVVPWDCGQMNRTVLWVHTAHWDEALSVVTQEICLYLACVIISLNVTYDLTLTLVIVDDATVTEL